MRQFSYPNSQFTTILGGASIGWKLNVYDTGTTNFASIYSDLGQTVPTANPVIADADGFLASFYWTGTVDVVLTDENDNIIDSANGIQDLVSTINAVVVAGNITLPFGDAAGDGDTITATLPITSDFSDGGVFVVRANAANTGASNTPNLQINSYASRRIKKIGSSALIANDIVSGMNMILVYHEAQDCYYLINHEATFLKRDGTAAMLAALNMGNQKITSLAAGTAAGDAVRLDQLPAAATTSVLGLVTLAQVELAVASGIVTAYAGDTVPTNWLECNGAAISRTTYAALFAAIGVLWGVGDGSTTFNLPDMRGEFLRGYDHGRGVDSGRALASSQTDEFESHLHNVSFEVVGVGGGTNNFPAPSNYSGGASYNYITSNSGGTETRPRNITMMYIIKT